MTLGRNLCRVLTIWGPPARVLLQFSCVNGMAVFRFHILARDSVALACSPRATSRRQDNRHKFPRCEALGHARSVRCGTRLPTSLPVTAMLCLDKLWLEPRCCGTAPLCRTSAALMRSFNRLRSKSSRRRLRFGVIAISARRFGRGLEWLRSKTSNLCRVFLLWGLCTSRFGRFRGSLYRLGRKSPNLGRILFKVAMSGRRRRSCGRHCD